MSGRRWLLALGVFLLLLATAGLALAVGSREPRATVSVVPRSPHALDPALVELRTALVLPASRLRVHARSPGGDTRTVHTALVDSRTRRGTFRFATPGLWRLQVTDPAGRPVAGAVARSVRVLDPVPTTPPKGFGAVGEPGCEPPSPMNASQSGFRDIFGTAFGREVLWALPFLPKGASWASRDSGTVDGIAGKGVKIVFGMTAFHSPFVAIGPEGEVLRPSQGPAFHGGSNWVRQPGTEWGSVFVFPDPGCWEVRVGSRGSVFLLIRS